MAEAANPLDAVYYAQLAKLGFQEENTLAENARNRAQTNAGYAYNKGALTRAEPRALQNVRNQANSQGLLESGQLADRRGQTQTDYASKQGRADTLRRSAIERINASNKTAEQAYSLGDTEAQLASGQRAKEALERNPPPPAAEAAPAVSYPTPPAQQAAINAGTPAGPGGVVPYGYGTGKVRVRAAKKAVG